MSVALRLPYLPRILIAVMSVLLVLLMGVSVVGAQGSEEVETGELAVPSDNISGIVALGTQVTIAGSGFAPGAQIEIVFASDPVLLATVTADPTGSFQATVTIPTSGVVAGLHHIRASGASATGGLLVLEVPVQTEGDITAQSGALPMTGGATLPVVIVALSAIAVGGLLTQRHRLTQPLGRRARSEE